MKNFDKIENLVQTRQTAQAHAYIVKELRKLSHDMNFQVQVSDWYRRLGLNKESLKVLKLNEISIRTNWSTQLPEGRVLTQAAFVLNQLGASAFALKIANLLHTNDPLEVSKLGEIYLANYEYSKAEICFQKALHGSVDKNSNKYNAIQISFADSLAGCGKYQDAIDVIEKIHVPTENRLLQGVCYQVIGEYYAKAHNYKIALENLNAAVPFFSPTDMTVDSAFLYKWLGFVQAKSGDALNAKLNFQKATTILKKLKVRVDAVMDLILLKAQANLASKKEIQQLLHYPGHSLGFENLLQEMKLKIKPPQRIGSANAKIKLYTSSDEYSIDEKKFIKMPNEIKFLKYVLLGGKWGLSSQRLKSLMWPDEIGAFLHLDARMHQFQVRLKNQYKIRITLVDSILKIHRDDLKKVALIFNEPAQLSFLNSKKTFKRTQFAKYYNLSTTQAKYHLQGLINTNTILLIGSGPSSHYKVL